MAAKITGNHAPYRNGLAGIGAASVPQGLIGWVGAVSEKADDVLYLPITECAGNNTRPLGFAFQLVGSGSATVQFTLQNAGLACDPDPAVQAAVKWVDGPTPITLTGNGPIVQSDMPFSALKVTFASKGTEFYVVSK
ncbi:TPA: hypothetical protein ACH1LG_004710 [Salmonella enterica]|jgi:hypothetical protein|uniref:hypothetical protein n=9 Tax=Bacteria TaxID=2 RepID=UPI00206FB70A|nr:hypothetical protein [Staphylococcus aureus]ELL1201409.1 hypothetical protein [Staphylococcus aureus]DAH95879.1 MAG TPA: hypothetical protein [Caudoviricetes sp.]DAH95967.1 MAG TPA: hypothetical protein [Caudoviricetes sp.]